MTKATIEDLDERVTALEKNLSELMQRPPADKTGWRSTIGLFAGDDVMKEIFELGHQIRATERRDSKK